MINFLLEQNIHFLFSYGFSAGNIEDHVIVEKKIEKGNRHGHEFVSIKSKRIYHL